MEILGLDSNGSVNPTIDPPSKKQKKERVLESFPLLEQNEEYCLESIYYILCNELGQEEILDHISTGRPNGGHIGFSCWFNFDIIVKTRPLFAILFDIDSNMIALLNLIKEKILHAETPQEFMEIFWDSLKAEKRLHFEGFLTSNGLLDFKKFEHLMQEKGWLSNQDNFLVIKNMYLNKKIVHCKLNITDGEKFEKIQNWLHTNQLAIDTLYSSNIPEWIYNESQVEEEKMLQNLDKIVDPQTKILTAYKKSPLGSEPPKLYLFEGKHPKICYQTIQKPTKKRSLASKMIKKLFD